MAPWLLALATLGAVATAHATLRRWVRRRERRDSAAAATAATATARVRWWVSRSIRDCASPLALVLWIQGLHGASSILLLEPDLARWAPLVRQPQTWLYGGSLSVAFLWLFSRAGIIVDALLLAQSRNGTAWDSVLLPIVGRAARRLLPLVALGIGASILPLPSAFEQAARQTATIALIGVMGWLAMQAAQVAVALVLRRHPVDVTDNLQARTIHTQVVVLRKIANALIGVFTLASILMVFDSARQFGASILASAGIAGLVVGLAAQRSIGTLLAGFQIALTQPIRVDDVVIVEGEWGQVEDITLTYVVVRIWDQRRLVVPITFFIEKPFQNWTRASAELVGSVFLHVDYTMSVPALREELTRVLQQSRYWDGNVNVLQVTDAKEHTLEVRALASATNASLAWDLRCEVREQLIAFVQRHSPGSLPRLRTSFVATADPPADCSPVQARPTVSP